MYSYFLPTNSGFKRRRNVPVLCSFFAVILMLLLSGKANAQQKSRLYATVLVRGSFVVGSAAAPSGLFSYDGNGKWTHYGWGHNRAAGFSYDPGNPDYMFMACGAGAFRSTDGGQTWVKTTGWKETDLMDISIDPINPDNVYFATDFGVWKSNNRGATWDSARVGIDSTYMQVIVVDHSKAAYILSGGKGGIFRSTNGARNWTHVGPMGVSDRDLQQNAKHPDLWLAGTGGKGVFISHDGGKIWQQTGGRKLRKSVIYAVASDPNDPDIMAAAGYHTGVYITTNGGKSWTRHVKGLPTPNIHSLIFDPDHKGKLWIGTYNHGVWSTSDLGKTWDDEGLDKAQVWDLVFVTESK